MAFDFISFAFHKEGLLVISSWKSVWYILRCVEIIRNIYILWDMVFVICMGIICRYFVGDGSFIYIYIYILWETWNLKVHERYVWVFCGECVWKIYGSVRWIIWKLNVERAVAGIVFCVMTLIMLLSKKEDFVWEIKNEMEMCFE